MTKKNLPPDEHIRKRALDIHQSFIVQAPAGSGKTGLLTLRFLSLLTAVEKAPEECLALTFTRKAASEMQQRILDALTLAASGASANTDYENTMLTLARKVLERDKLLGWGLLMNPNRLKIQTIDALLASITRSLPFLSGLSGPREVASDPKRLYAIAANNFIKKLESDEPYVIDLSNVIEHLDNNLSLVERLFAEILAQREQWLPYVGQLLHSADNRKQLEKSLQILVIENLSSLKNFEETLSHLKNEMIELWCFAASELQKTDIESPILHCLECRDWPGVTLNDLAVWQGIASLFLTETHTLRKTVTEKQGFPALKKAKTEQEKNHYKVMKERFLSLLEYFQEYPSFCQALQACKECPPLHYSELQWQCLESLITILPFLVRELNLIFQESGQIDFVEISLRAIQALGHEDPSDLALSLDYKIRHILIDEFQDTSLPQFRLLEQLTRGWQVNDGRTLFLVGDPMQSIYRFRQAEVGLFLKVKNSGVNDIILESLTLTSNFRSDPILVQGVNETFAEIFPKKDNFQMGAICFSPSNAVQQNCPMAEIKRFEINNINEAEKIAELWFDVKKRAPKGSIALLVRSRTELGTLLPKLRHLGVAYQGIDLELLNQRQVVVDLLILSRALVHLQDRVAWLALLRGPNIGLSLNDIYVIANYDATLPIWWALQHFKVLPLSQDAQTKLEKSVPILAAALEDCQRYSFSTWILKIWQALGSFLHFTEDEWENAESFFQTLEEQQKNVDFFKVGTLEASFEFLYSKSKRLDPHALQILTIHKAKGLEFDTVILTGLGKQLKRDTEKLFLWEERPQYEEKPYLVLAPIKAKDQQADPIYNYLKLQNKKRAHFEEQRLLYVAMTRAKKRLYCLYMQNECSLISSEDSFTKETSIEYEEFV